MDLPTFCMALCWFVGACNDHNDIPVSADFLRVNEANFVDMLRMGQVAWKWEGKGFAVLLSSWKIKG